MGSAVWSQTFVMAHAYVFKLDHHWFKYRLLPVRYKSFTVADEELWPIGLLEKINEFWFEESINNFHTQNRKHWKSVIPKSAYKWSTTCEAYKTRNNQRAQTSDNAYVRSVKQSGQAWNSLTKAAKITKKNWIHDPEHAPNFVSYSLNHFRPIVEISSKPIRVYFSNVEILSVIPWIIFDLSWKFHQNPFVCISAHMPLFPHEKDPDFAPEHHHLLMHWPWYHFRPIPENPLQSIKKTFFQ